MNSISSKKFFKNYGVFLLILIVFVAVLAYLIFLSKPFWKDNLKVTVEKVLEEKQPGKWFVNDYIEINNPMTTSAAAYNIISSDTKTEAKAVILRIITFYGPVSALYIVHDKENIEFVGIASLHGRISKQIGSSNNDMRIKYWAKRIPAFFE